LRLVRECRDSARLSMVVVWHVALSEAAQEAVGLMLAMFTASVVSPCPFC